MEERLFEQIRRSFLNKKPVIVIDEEREKEGDFVYPAELMDERVAELFVKYGKGLFCVVGPEDNLIERGFFKLPTNYNANYFVPLDFGNGTGISTSERAETCRQLANNDTKINNFKYPGHVTLIGAKDFSKRRGHSESSVELVKMLGFKPFSTIIEILDEEGNSHNLEYVYSLAKKLDLTVLNIRDIWKMYIKRNELMRIKSIAKLPTELGDFKIVSFENNLDGQEHVAIIKEWNREDIPLVRIHSECFTGDTLSSLRCDCGSQLSKALQTIAEKGGVLLYLRQEGRGIGLANKIQAYHLQDQGYDTYEANVQLGFKADERDYSIAYQMLRALGVNELVLLTNNPEKVKQLESYGINVIRTERIFGRVTIHNKFYLTTKLVKFHHTLEELLRGEV